MTTINYPDYCFEETLTQSFWRCQGERFDTYLRNCTIDDGGYCTKDYRISVLVTSYNSEEFIEECLSDLENQTISASTEIIFVDAQSPQNEREIVHRFQKKYSNIRYVRTPERIGIYPAWNLAARLARGSYLTTFSTNDRLRIDAHELMAAALDAHPGVMMVYGDSYITNIPHESFDNFTTPTKGRTSLKWPPYEFLALLNSCMIGPHPMWRKEAHTHIGYWDERFHALGDQDFFLRIGEKHPLYHLDVFTGLYWWTDDAVSLKGWLPWLEESMIRMRYWQRYRLKTNKQPYSIPPPEVITECEELYRSGISHLENGNIQESHLRFSRVMEIHPNHSGAHAGLGKLYLARNDTENALRLFINAVIRNPLDIETLKLLALCGKQAGKPSWVTPFIWESMKLQNKPELLNLIKGLQHTIS